MGSLRRLGEKLSTMNMIARNLHQAAGEIEQFFVRMSIVCTGRCTPGIGRISLPLSRRRSAHPKARKRFALKLRDRRRILGTLEHQISIMFSVSFAHLAIDRDCAAEHETQSKRRASTAIVFGQRRRNLIYACR